MTWYYPSGIDWIIVVCYCCDLVWVMGCSALVPVNKSSEKR